MKISRIFIIIIVLVVIGVFALFAYETVVANTSGSSLWNRAAEYPLNVGGSYGVGGQQCVSSTVYIYCVGGVDANNGPRDQVYTSSPISATSPGITSWAPDSNLYPLDINSASCVTFSDKIYCIGGIDDDNGDDTSATYYASLNNGIVGSWIPTTAYPIGIDTQSCVAS